MENTWFIQIKEKGSGSTSFIEDQT